MLEGYSGKLKDGSEIYIPLWSATDALESLTKAGKYIGSDHLIRITELNIPSVMLAILESEDSKNTAGLIKNFVCAARVDGERITLSNYDSMFEGDLFKAAEVFAHVVKAQYASFFVQGLAKETSPED